MANIKNVIQTGSGFSLHIQGVSEILKNLELTKNQRGRLQKFLEEEANKVIKTAKKIVPVDTGRLRDSHRVLTHGATGRTTVRVDIVAGGLMVRGRYVNYARAVHNNNPWLEAALRVHEHGYQDRLAKAIKIYGRRG